MLANSFKKTVKHLKIWNLTPFVEDKELVDFCEKCATDLDKVGICECMKSDECDHLSLVPEDCFKCSDKVIDYCKSKEGNKFNKIWTQRIDFIIGYFSLQQS